MKQTVSAKLSRTVQLPYTRCLEESQTPVQRMGRTTRPSEQGARRRARARTWGKPEASNETGGGGPKARSRVLGERATSVL